MIKWLYNIAIHIGNLNEIRSNISTIYYFFYILMDKEQENGLLTRMTENHPSSLKNLHPDLFKMFYMIFWIQKTMHAQIIQAKLMLIVCLQKPSLTCTVFYDSLLLIRRLWTEEQHLSSTVQLLFHWIGLFLWR